MDGVVAVGILDGGPSGGNGLADIEAVVGLVIEELLRESWFELCPELILEREPRESRDPGPVELRVVGRLTILAICLDCPRELGKDV